MSITTAVTSKEPISGIRPHAALIAATDFKFKSLCHWVFKTAVGCGHGCRSCYVPSTAANKQKPLLKNFGVNSPDAEWGEYSS
jgi:DNA repair photolyase